MLLRFYTADGRRTSQHSQENVTPNLIKNTSPEFRKVETDIVKPSQGSSGNSNQDTKKKLVLLFSPIIAAAIIYQVSWYLSTQKYN